VEERIAINVRVQLNNFIEKNVIESN